MFKVKWDKTNNGIIISEYIDEIDSIVPPRPVYSDELRTLNLDEVFVLPDANVPVCWESNRKYYYFGDILFETKGGNIFEDPDIIINESYRNKHINPIDIQSLIIANEEIISILENEAMDFIKQKYEEYKESKAISGFVVAFSGGKDSQVVLDLVSRVIPHERFKTVFTNTGMELPCTLELMKTTEGFYKERYPGFIIEQARSNTTALELWKRYGPPSRINRWCCSVLKTALFGRKMKELLRTDSQPRLIVFEGVRNDESVKRSSYNRVGVGVKHVNLTNCRPILKWNVSEVFLYMYKNGVIPNTAYTFGLTRVGCGVCPFASDWSEFIIRKKYPKIAEDYIGVVKEMARTIGITSDSKINEYISSGNWKKNAGGKGLVQDLSRMDIISKEPNFECIVTNPKVSWETWFSTIGEYFIEEEDGNNIKGELKFDNVITKFSIIKSQNSFRFIAYETKNKIMLVSFLTRVFIKTAYCELCGVCEIECPTGALTVRDSVQINKQRCVHCHNCLEVNSKGCIIATRKTVYEGGKNMSGTATKTSTIDKYSTFGMRMEWVTTFFNQMDEWFDGYGMLGVKQITAMLNWLKEAELIDYKDKKVTELAKVLKPIYDTNKYLVWQIIWINLSFNSTVANWYVNHVDNSNNYSKIELVELLKEDFPQLKGATLKNPIDALINTFCNSPLGTDDINALDNLKVGFMEKKGAQVKSVCKLGTSRISSIAVAYSLYKYAESTGSYELTVSDFYNKGYLGVANIFNMDLDSFLNALRGLTNYEVLTADLLGGLDNIHLVEELKPIDVLKQLIKRY